MEDELAARRRALRNWRTVPVRRSPMTDLAARVQRVHARVQRYHAHALGAP